MKITKTTTGRFIAMKIVGSINGGVWRFSNDNPNRVLQLYDDMKFQPMVKQCWELRLSIHKPQANHQSMVGKSLLEGAETNGLNGLARVITSINLLLHIVCIQIKPQLHQVKKLPSRSTTRIAVGSFAVTDLCVFLGQQSLSSSTQFPSFNPWILGISAGNLAICGGKTWQPAKLWEIYREIHGKKSFSDGMYIPGPMRHGYGSNLEFQGTRNVGDF